MRANSKAFLSAKFPELLQYKRRSSRMYEKTEKPSYHDDWWFKFMFDDLNSSEFIVLAGALDYANKDFRVFKVPSSYLLQNINKLDMNENGEIFIAIHMEDLTDLRSNNHLSFRDFALN